MVMLGLHYQGRSVCNRSFWLLSLILSIAGVVLLAIGSNQSRACRNNIYYPCINAAIASNRATFPYRNGYTNEQANYCANKANNECHLQTNSIVMYVGAAIFGIGILGTLLFCCCLGAYSYDDEIIITHTLGPQQTMMVPQQVYGQQYGQQQYSNQPQYQQQKYQVGQQYGQQQPMYNPVQPGYPVQQAPGMPAQQQYPMSTPGKAI